MNKPTNEDRDRLSKIIEQHVAALGEHFDSVQILCNNVEEGADSTCTFIRGSWNWYARQHQAREGVMDNDEQSRQKARKDFMEDNP